MTAKRRLVPVSEVKEMLDFLRKEQIDFAGVDIRADGVTFFPANAALGNAYDAWKKEPGRDRNPRRSLQN